MQPTANIEEAIDFLRHWRAEGPWALVAIPPNQSGLQSGMFGPETEQQCRAWLEQRINSDNIYFTVNPLVRPMEGANSKAKKADVRGMAWLHVDVDPRPGEPLVSERERALRVLQNYVPPPTVIVDSGGGYQGFWRLTEEQPINGNIPRAEELEAYNLQIELTLTSQSQCFNVDRIMRLPGTINWPTEKKRKKGRMPAPATVAEANWERVYPLTAFTAAQRVQSKESTGNGGGPRVEISGNLPRIASLDDLPAAVTQRTKMLIVQGDDPDDPTKYHSESEVVFAICCELVRANVDDNTIAAILLDHDYGCSRHIYRQNRPQEYTARQIRRAREDAINPHLRRLNEEHAVIEDLGGKCRVISEVYDYALNRARISKQTFDDFRNRYMHIQVDMGVDQEGRPIRVPLGKFWLANPMRRQYKTMVFAPGKETPESYNLWKGFACEARPGDCSLYLAHIKENICIGNEEYYNWLLNWMARVVQMPNSAGETAIVLRGGQGTGKGKFAKVFGSLFGRHFMPVSDPKHLVGNFNSHLRDCVVLFGDEAFFAGDKRHESILKTIVTEETMNIEAKGVDVEVAPNYVHMVLSSNSDWVIPAGVDERRYFVLDVSDAKAQDTKYFAAIDREMENGGREALLHMLMTRKLDGFEVRTAPKTAALQDQKILSLSPVEEWWHEVLQNGKVGRGDEGWRVEVPKEELLGDLNRYMERQKVMRRPSPTLVGKFMKRVMEEGFPQLISREAEQYYTDEYGQQRSRQANVTFFVLQNLDICREIWDKRYGQFKWLANGHKPNGKAPF